jgi:hypothetical protein
VAAGCSTDSEEPTETPTTEALSNPDTFEETPKASPTDADPKADAVTTEEDPEADADEYAHLNGLSGITAPPEDVGGDYSRRFDWSALSGDWWFELNIPRRLGDYYKERYGRSREYDAYISDAYGDEYITFIADEFDRLGDKHDLSEYEVVDLAMAFVQQMQYTADDVATPFDQYTQYPVETLIERGGDCEDTALLLAAILREMGYGCVLLYLRETDPAHIAVGVKGDESIERTYYEYDGARYYFVEPTAKWRFGEMPEFSGSTTAQFLDISTYPTVVYAWEVEVDPAQPDGVTVNTAMANHGPGSGLAPGLTLSFEGRDELVIANESVSKLAMDAGEEVTESVRLQPPTDVAVRLYTELVIDGSIHDTQTSEWREPI